MEEADETEENMSSVQPSTSARVETAENRLRASSRKTPRVSPVTSHASDQRKESLLFKEKIRRKGMEFVAHREENNVDLAPDLETH